jgi:putative MATE family efflux protein
MLTRKHFLNVIALGVPLMAGMVSEFFMYIADSVMVGRLGTEYLAAMAIATLFAEIMWVLVWPFAPGTQALSARRYGRQEADAAIDAVTYSRLQRATGDILDNALVVSFVVGIAVIAAASFSLSVLRLLLSDPQLMLRANAYIRIIKWVMPLAGIFYAMYGFLAAVNLTRAIMVATVGLNLLNIFFNYLLIFGKFGFPALGIAGAAIGTLLAHVLGTVYLAAYIFLSKSTRGYRCGRFSHLQWRLVKDIVLASWPMIVQLGIVLSIFLYYESIIADIGTTCLAVTHIIFTMFILNRTLVGGFAEGGAVLIGNHLGCNEPEEALRYGYATECIAFLFGILLVVLILLFPQGIVRVFNQEPETVALGIDGLRFFTFFIFVNIVGYPLETIFTHNGWGKYPLVTELISIVIFTLGLTLVLVRYFKMGIYAAWFALGLYTICYTLLLAGGFWSKRWLAVEIERDTGRFDS